MSGSGLVTSERLKGLLDAVVTMSGDLTLDGTLQRIVRSASDLVDARHGYLGVLDGHPDQRLGTFAVHGVDEGGWVSRDGLAQGRSLLGLVVDLPGPLRTDDPSEHPDRAAFPAMLPAMTSLLGVPVRVQDRVIGNLYLTEKIGGEPFDAEDEAIAVALASAAGVVIENARLYEEGERQRTWLAATADIAGAILRPISRAGAKRLVTERARDVSGADVAALLMPDADGALYVRAVSGLPLDLVDSSEGPTALLAEVVGTGQTVVLAEALTDARYDPDPGSSWPPLSSLHAMPLKVANGVGVLLMGWLQHTRAPAWALDPELPRGYAQQASLVMRVVRAQEDGARLAVFEDRDRIGRDLHDVVIQRLFAVGLVLDSTTRQVTSEPVRERLSAAVDDLDQTIRDIRRTIFELTTPIGPMDLAAELRAVLADAAPVLGFTPVLETRGPVESVVTPVVAEQLVAVLKEAVSNVVRHAQASSVNVLLDCTGDIELVVEDDGAGLGEDHRRGNGLRNMRHRAQNLGGSCRFDSRPGRGLGVRWRVPKEPV